LWRRRLFDRRSPWTGREREREREMMMRRVREKRKKREQDIMRMVRGKREWRMKT